MQKGSALIFLLIGTLIITVAGGAFYLGRQTTPKPSPIPVTTSQPTSKPSPTQSPADETTNWKTYTNPANTFSLRYPPERIVIITDSGLVRVEPEDLSTSRSGLSTVTDIPDDNRVILLYYGSLNGKVLKDLVIEEYNKDKSGADDNEVSPDRSQRNNWI